MFSESFYLEQCRQQIETLLGWGDSTGWRNQDFIVLGEKIMDATGVLLSVTTLKRIWGKLPYDSQPNPNTLNALAAYLGHENWQSFRATIVQELPAEARNANSGIDVAGVVSKPAFRSLRWFLLLVPVPAVLLWFLFLQSDTIYLSPEALDRVQFSSSPVTAGVPNTVVFQYDVAHLGDVHVQIQQTWDSTRRVVVPAGRHEATTTYYYPGYWRAKLLVDGRIVREHDLFIRSEGWLATLGRGDRPRYFLPGEWSKDGRLAIADTVLNDIYQRREPDWLTFHYIDDFGDLDGDHFTFSARLRNTYRQGDGVCRETRLIVQCTEGALVIPLCAPGCVGDLRLMLSDRILDGKDHDLSALGCDFDQWQKLRGEVQDRRVSLFLNGQPVLETTYERPLGRVAGIRLRFWGAGEVDAVQLAHPSGQISLSEHF